MAILQYSQIIVLLQHKPLLLTNECEYEIMKKKSSVGEAGHVHNIDLFLTI